MLAEIRGKIVLVIPENPDDSIRIEQKLAGLVNAGYRVEKRKWGGLVITDPALRFKWETQEVLVDVRRILGID